MFPTAETVQPRRVLLSTDRVSDKQKVNSHMCLISFIRDMSFLNPDYLKLKTKVFGFYFQYFDIGRTDAEAETPILWPSYVKS